MKRKKLGKKVGALLLTLVPFKALYFTYLAALRDLDEPQNPLRDAVDNRVYPFGH